MTSEEGPHITFDESQGLNSHCNWYTCDPQSLEGAKSVSVQVSVQTRINWMRDSNYIYM